MMNSSTRSQFLQGKRRTLSVLILATVGLMVSASGFCRESQGGLLSEYQIQQRLNHAGYAPLWQIRRRVSDYLVEGIDPQGNPVILQVDPVTADIHTLESLALLN